MVIDYQNALNSEQLDVVLHGDGPCLILAGAGSGKTRTITYRVAYLLEQGIHPENILLVTFTNKAAREMLTRVERLLGRYPTGLWGGTFHAIANRLLRVHGARLGYSPNFTILDEEDAKGLIKACVKALNLDPNARRFPSPARLHAMMSYARNSGRTIGAVVESRYPNVLEIKSVIEQIAGRYADRKHQADAMDFDDLLLNLRELLHRHEDVHQRLAHQFEYILVDEYQDTNVVQAEIVRSLAREHGNMLVVGDDAQSIYSFRAAEIRNILGFPQSHHNAKVFRLTTNYRSTSEILAVANASILQNVNQFQKELRAARGSLMRPCLMPAGDARGEAQCIAQKILVLRAGGMSLSQIAVLFRAAFHSQALELELMKRNIPYEYRGGLKFFERAHVKDVVAHLRARQNSKDEMAWMRVLGLLNGVGSASAESMVLQFREHESLERILVASLKIPPRVQASWEACRKTFEKMSREEHPAKLVRAVISGDYREYLEAEYTDFMDRLEDLEQLALFAEGYGTLREFLDEVSLASEFAVVPEGTRTQDEGRVVLSTIHQAKGLEWDAVFVMHLADGKFPIQVALQEDGGLEEERRLFYVATTRARKELYFTYPMASLYDTLFGQPSVFVRELPQDLLRQVPSDTLPDMAWKEMSRGCAGDWNDEPTIVLNDLGERVHKPLPKMNFLRDIHEL